MKFTSWFLMFTVVASAEGADLPACRHAFTVIAHRGDHARAHENTLSAIEQAIAAGVDYVEIDVRRTVDGHYVLMHDSTVDRMTDGHGRVSELTLKQLQALHVSDSKRPQIPKDHIPTFNEALAVIKGRINIYLDFKEGDREEVAKAIREAGVTKQVLVYDDADSVLAWRRAAPELPLIVSLPETPEHRNSSPVLSPSLAWRFWMARGRITRPQWLPLHKRRERGFGQTFRLPKRTRLILRRSWL